MPRRNSVFLFSILACVPLASPTRAQVEQGVARPPVAHKEPHRTIIHGDNRVDDYYWLRQKTSPEVVSYLEAENAYTRAIMRPTEPLQEDLYKEMLGRIKQTDLSVPYRLGGWSYYSRTEEGKQYPIHCRRRAGGPEQITLDLNELAKGHRFLSLGAYVVSDDGHLLAYSTDVTGFREYTLQVKDLGTGRTLPERLFKVTTIAWAADNKTLFFVTEDHAKRPFRLQRHLLGQPGTDTVYEEKDELFRLGCRRSRDRAFLFATSLSSTTSEARYLPSEQPGGAWRIIRAREDGHEYHVDHRGDLFYIRTNKGAKNFRLVTIPAADPRPLNWKELVPHRPDIYLAGVELFARHTVLEERDQGLQRLQILRVGGHVPHMVRFPEPTYALFPDANPEFDTNLFRFRYQSLVTPDSVYDYDMNRHEQQLLKRTEVLGGYDPSRYASERIYASAADGTRIPISLVYRKGLKRDGTAAMLLYGYGSYGLALPDSFQSQRLSLLDRGMVFAIAHIRGGGEMGRAWHDNGKMMHKRNTFTDFIAAADHLVAERYTSRERLAIEGRSAGGLLIGAVLNLRPDLCRVAVLGVPFVDVINTMLDPSLPLTVQEYLEWGNPSKQAEYEYMKSYCPYTNLAHKDYPAILVFTSLNDSQVMYWEPAKYTAKLRTLKTDQHPLLLRVNMAAGHGGASGRYDALREAAMIYAFMLTELGVTP